MDDVVGEGRKDGRHRDERRVPLRLVAVADLPSKAAILPSLRQAWTNIWPNFWWLLLFGVLALLANAVSGGDEYGVEGRAGAISAALDLVGAALTIFVGIPLGVGVVKAHLVASRGTRPTWKDLGYAFGPRYWPSIGLGLLTLLITVGGLLLLVIPGIYWGVRLVFASQRFVSDELGVMDSIRASRADVTGRWWNVFGLVLMSIPLLIAGALALGVGILVALVLIQQMFVVYWRALAQEGSKGTRRERAAADHGPAPIT